MQQIAKDTDHNDMQIVSFHPGGVRTEAARNIGVPEDLYDWDDGMCTHQTMLVGSAPGANE